MRQKINTDGKCIVLDEVTEKFIKSLKERRMAAGMTQKTLAKATNLHPTSVSDYERGRSLPSLHPLMKLAEVLSYDLSPSLNYKYFHGQIKGWKLRLEFKELGLTYLEMSRLTGYDARLVKDSLNLESTMSVPCLAAIIGVLDRESKSLLMRSKMLQKSRRQRHV